MSLFEKVAQLSNDGVDSLLNGDWRSAIKSTSEAIKCMIVVVSLRTTNDDSSSAALARPLTCRKFINDAHTVEIPSMEASETTDFNQQAIRLPADDEAVIFNLALAYHFIGDKSSMVRAKKFCAMVIKLLNGDSLQHVHMALTVKLACINNSSQIRYSQSGYKQARAEGINQVSVCIQQNNIRLDRSDMSRDFVAYSYW